MPNILDVKDKQTFYLWLSVYYAINTNGVSI